MFAITTQKQLRADFWRNHPQFKDDRKAGKTQNDYRADVRAAWCDHVERQHRNGAISEALADRATL